MKALRPIGHEERLSIVDHLDELRSRMIACGVFMVVVFAVCFWQNQALLKVLNRALPPAATTGLGSQQHLNATLGQTLKHASTGMEQLSTELANSRGVAPGAADAARSVSHDLLTASKEYPKTASEQAKPITIGVGESFTTTLTVVGYFTLLISLPMILYQLYAFVIPALSRSERRIAIPTMAAAPLLFVAGAVFTYFEVLPPAIHFLQGYNSEQFQILVQARTYYRFEILLMLGIGLAFQVPLLLLGLQKVGLITSRTLTLNWRYAIVLIAVIAAALPGVDPVTMFFETIPLVLLYVASIVMLKIVDYRTAKREAAELSELGRVDGLDAT
jgi:sec-independent protein translocase protein TatC